MQCPSCSFESPKGFDFCGRCGAALGSTCPACEFQSPSGFSFCGRCGTQLGARADAPAEESGARSEGARAARDEADEGAMRRQVTVMFCDLANSTALAERLDPEELRELIRSYQRVVTGIVERARGHVAQYLGDGVLVYFGYPRAEEDDARRAVSAGLAIVGEMADLAADFRDLGIDVAVRIGVHTGVVVVGTVGGGRHHETLALGSTPNVAARLQGIADPNQVVLSDLTRRLVKNAFELESLGCHELKGVAEPVTAYRALKERDLGTYGLEETEALVGLTPLRGRGREMQVLREACERAAGGEGQVVLLSGEAGVGKSRLQVALHEEARAAGTAWLTLRCSPDYRNSAFKPVYHFLRRSLGIRGRDAPAQQLERLRAGLRSWGCPEEEYLPLLAELLSIPNEGSGADTLSPQLRKEKTLDALVACVELLAAKGPLIMAVDDLHWVDPSTLGLLDRLVQRRAHARWLLLLSYRPEIAAPWAEADGIVHLELEPLRGEDVRALIAAVTGGVPIPDAVASEIAERTDGVPLFVEELTSTLMRSNLLRLTESGYELVHELPHTAIPSSLHDLLAAKLDRLGPSRELAQECSVLGRRFSYQLVRAVSPLDEIPLRSRLAYVVQEGVLVEHGDPPEAQHSFKHALLQDAAYESLLKSQRRRLHARVGEILETRFPGMAEDAPEIVAQHFEAADMPRKALAYRRLAGERASDKWAHVEAIAHYQRALELLDELGGGADRRGEELGLLAALGVAQIATRGYAAPEVERTYRRAARLSAELGDIPFAVRYGTWAFTFVRADGEAAADQAAWFERHALDAEDPDELLMSHACLANWAFYGGDLARAGRELEATRKLFRADAHHRVALAHGGCGGFYGHLLTVWWHLLTGHPRRAFELHDEVVALAESLRHPYTLAMALSYGLAVAHDARDIDRAAELAGQLAELSREQAFPFLGAIALVGQGWAACLGGDGDEGLALLERGLTLYRATGALILVPYYSSWLAEAHLAAGRRHEARRVVEDALAISRTSLDRFHEAELLRLLGDSIVDAQVRRGEELYRQAMDLADEQGARLLGLRAAVSLSRVLVASGRGAEARALLKERTAGLDEGEDARDFVEARAALAAAASEAT